MLRLRPALLGLLLALSGAVPAQAATLVDVPIDSPLDVAVLSDRLGLDVTHDVTATRARVLLHSAADRAALRRGGFVAEVIVRDVTAVSRRAFRRDLRRARASASSGLPSGRDARYRVLSEYRSELSALATGHPGLVRALTLSERSVEGRAITGVEIASNVNRDDDGRPVFAVFGVHHAREWPSGEVALEFAHDLAKNYGVSPRVTSLLDRVRIIVVPVVNVDGFVASRGDDPLAAHGPEDQRRKNCAPRTAAEAAQPCTVSGRSGVDLNRNYSAGWGGAGAGTEWSSNTFRGPAPFSEPEARGVHDLLQRRQVTGVQSIHNIVGQVLRQPGNLDHGATAPDDGRMKDLGDRIAAAAGYDSIAGHELYPVNGATEDWNYVAQGAYGYTIELGPKSEADPPVFHGAYATSVVEQYLGSPSRPDDGVREGLLIAADAAADVRDHAVLTGTAPAGALLRLRRDFSTDTARVCPAATSPGTSPPPCTSAIRTDPIRLDDFVETTLRVPADGRFTWHAGPSTRPWVGRDGTLEAWTLSCSLDDGATAVASERVVVGRGQTAPVTPCESGNRPAVTWTDPGPGPGPGGGPGVVSRRVRLFVGGLRVKRAVAGRSLVVPMSITGGIVRGARATFVDRRFRIVSSRGFAKLSGRRTVHLELPRPLAAGRYRLTVRGTDASGTAVVGSSRLTIKHRR